MTIGSADAALTNTNVARARATSRTDRVARTRTLATNSLLCSRKARKADALAEMETIRARRAPGQGGAPMKRRARRVQPWMERLRDENFVVLEELRFHTIAPWSRNSQRQRERSDSP